MKCCDLICIVPLFWESKGESLALSPVKWQRRAGDQKFKMNY